MDPNNGISEQQAAMDLEMYISVRHAPNEYVVANPLDIRDRVENVCYLPSSGGNVILTQTSGIYYRELQNSPAVCTFPYVCDGTRSYSVGVVDVKERSVYVVETFYEDLLVHDDEVMPFGKARNHRLLKVDYVTGDWWVIADLTTGGFVALGFTEDYLLGLRRVEKELYVLYFDKAVKEPSSGPLKYEIVTDDLESHSIGIFARTNGGLYYTRTDRGFEGQTSGGVIAYAEMGDYSNERSLCSLPTVGHVRDIAMDPEGRELAVLIISYGEPFRLYRVRLDSQYPQVALVHEGLNLWKVDRVIYGPFGELLVRGNLRYHSLEITASREEEYNYVKYGYVDCGAARIEE